MGHCAGRQHNDLLRRCSSANETTDHLAHSRLGGVSKYDRSVARRGDSPAWSARAPPISVRACNTPDSGRRGELMSPKHRRRCNKTCRPLYFNSFKLSLTRASARPSPATSRCDGPNLPPSSAISPQDTFTQAQLPFREVYDTACHLPSRHTGAQPRPTRPQKQHIEEGKPTPPHHKWRHKIPRHSHPSKSNRDSESGSPWSKQQRQQAFQCQK